MNPLFTVLSAAYIFGIFYCADSSAVSTVGELNPFSILHVPLYGVLTGLLLLAVASRGESRLNARRVLAALAAIAVGLLDEYHQSFIPSRDASSGDVLLDAAGALLVLLSAFRFPPALWLKVLRRFKTGT